MNWWLVLAGWWLFGLLAVDYLMDGWHPFEKLLSAPLWPLVAWWEIRSW